MRALPASTCRWKRSQLGWSETGQRRRLWKQHESSKPCDSRIPILPWGLVNAHLVVGRTALYSWTLVCPVAKGL